MLSLPCGLIDENLRDQDFKRVNYDQAKLIRNLIDVNKTYLLASKFENNSDHSNGYVVELVEDLDDCKHNHQDSNIEREYSELISRELLKDSFDLVHKYDRFAASFVDQIFYEFNNKKSDSILKTNENGLEIRVSPDSSNQNSSSPLRQNSVNHDSSTDNNKTANNNNLPNIPYFNENSDHLPRRHSLNNNSKSSPFKSLNRFNSVNKLNKMMLFNNSNTKPTIIIDFEDESSNTNSTQSTDNNSKLKEPESNNQFKQYTKVTLKCILNKSPNSNRVVNTDEAILKNSDFLKCFVNNLVEDSMKEVAKIKK